MDFKDLARTRYSCRAYRSDPVEEEKLAAVLEAARMAPTACNRQAFRLYVLPTAGRREEVRKLYGRDWLAEAPLVIGIAGDSGRNWVRGDGRNYVDVDCAIVMDHLILQATDLGLGTCWIGAFDAPAARRLLDLPPGWEPIAFTPLGYPAEAGRPKMRKPIEEIVVRG
jgi:nitroreductase